MLHGSRDFNTFATYTGFVRKVVYRRDQLVNGKLEQEHSRVQSTSSPAPVQEYVNYRAR